MEAVLDPRTTPSGDRHLARLLALAMHGLFVALLVFGVSWQKKPEQPVALEVVSALPPLPRPQAPPPQPDVEPELPKPAPLVTPPPQPKAAPRPEPKPDIAMKQEKKKAEAKPEPKAEPRPEPKKREDDKAAAERKAAEARESELQRKLVEAEREAEAKAAAERAAEKAAADKAAAERAAKAAALQQELQRYRVNIIAKIRSRMVKFEGNMEAVFTVQLFPGGELQAVNMVRSSGNTEFDAAVRQAINQSQPFVVPTGELFHQHFRPLTLTFRP